VRLLGDAAHVESRNSPQDNRYTDGPQPGHQVAEQQDARTTVTTGSSIPSIVVRVAEITWRATSTKNKPSDAAMVLPATASRAGRAIDR
jgi:hypothetical protein